MDYQKKSYKLFILWIIFLYTLLMFGGYYLAKIFPDITDANLVNVEMMLINIALLILIYMIYRTESIYWINGMSYKEAKSMSSEKRKKYAWEHLIIFFQGTIISILYCIFSYFIKVPMPLDIIILTFIIIISAFRTIPIKP